MTVTDYERLFLTSAFLKPSIICIIPLDIDHIQYINMWKSKLRINLGQRFELLSNPFGKNFIEEKNT